MKTFGTCVLKDRVWCVSTEPHVAARLKRVFPRLGKGAGTNVRVLDTVEACHDLEWFFVRYPHEVTPAGRLKTRAAEHRDGLALVDRLLSGVRAGRKFDLALPPREYQALAAELALATRGLLVADDVGLGKTATAICALTEPTALPALVVAPAHLTRQWADELRRFAPNLQPHILKRGTPYDYIDHGRQRGLFEKHPDVLITSYHKLVGWADTLTGLVQSVIFDEVHELRRGPKDGREGSKKCTAARQIALAAKYRLGLTATPIFNYGGEFFEVVETLRPGAIGTKSEFLNEWCVWSNRKPRIRSPKQFGSYARDEGLMLRRTRKEVKRELPALTRAPQHVDADASRLQEIESAAAELARIILDKAERKLSKGEQFRAGGELDGLVRQATGLAKAPAVAEFVRMLLESDERVVLFGWHREVYRVWLDRLDDFRPALYTGTESESAKAKAKKRFVEKDTNLLIISLRSGAGLDGLQYSGCRTAVFGELDWSPACHEQCEGRVHRDGQPDPVVAYYLITDQGSDPIVADTLGVKKAQLEGLRDPSGNVVAKLDAGGANVRALAERYLRKHRGAA